MAGFPTVPPGFVPLMEPSGGTSGGSMPVPPLGVPPSPDARMGGSPGPAKELPSMGGAPNAGAGGGGGTWDNLIDAIVHHESGGNPNAIGKKGEIGLMQIEPATAKAYGVTPEQLRDPNVNRQVGTRYFTDLMQRYQGNPFKALMAYNEGPGRVDKGQFLPQSLEYASSIMKRAMSGVGNFFEGTANAQEVPPGFVPMGAPPTPPPGFVPEPTGSTKEIPTVAPTTGAPPSAAPTQPAAGGMNFGNFKPSIRIGGGPFSMTLQGQAPASSTTQVKNQEMAGKQVMAQVQDAIDFFDTHIKPKESQFTGTFATTPGSAFRGLIQGTEYSHSRFTEPFGGTVDPDVRQLYSKAGPIIGEQLKALVGGRVGQAMVEGPLAKHIPNFETDSIPMIRQKLEDLKHNIPILLRTIQQERAAGMSDDDIIESKPVFDANGNVVGYKKD